ncbi:FtsK/SpoIIIE domain-containing protein (plasmid) [Lactobacillus johnsonii]|uniref:FtsK/SpoIIIE domain-containing protein n=1 Tax=Lactobacillus johnsonii TaxID=33959 RepID=UPI00388E3AE9
MRVYRKNQRGYYSYGIYHYLAFWIVIFLGIFLLSTYVRDILKLDVVKDVEAVSLMSALFLGIIEIIKILVYPIKNKGLFKYFYSLSLERRIRKAFLNTMTLNIVKDLPRIEVPKIKVTFNDEKIYVFVQRLAGMNDLEKIQANINSAVVGKYRNFAVVELIQADDGTSFSFILEDLGTDKTFIPHTVDDLKQDPYFIELQENLTLNLSKYPHVAIWGQTGSGKTTVLMSVIAQCLSNNTELYFVDGKTEFSSFSVFYPKEKIATDNIEVVSLLKHISEIIMKRQKQMASAVQKRKELGLTGFDIKLKPIVVVADEVGSIVASMSSKEKKELVNNLLQIVQKGRSVSVFLVMASQSPATTVLPSDIRSQFSTRILLGSATGDTQRMAFDQVATTGGVAKFQGYYMTSGLTVQPQKFFVPNLYEHDLASMQIFERLYNEKE